MLKDSVKHQLQLALPKHLSVDRFLRVALTTIRGNKKLLECSDTSILSCLVTAGQLGLEVDPKIGHAYLVPFGGQAQLIPGYKGLLKLIRNSGELQSVQTQVVYANDVFELEYGLTEKLRHVPSPGDRGAPTGAYVVFRYKDGGYSFDYMSTDDIEKIRKRSKAGDSGPWVTDWAEMAKKTVLRRHSKIAPMSIEAQRAVALEETAMAGLSQWEEEPEAAEEKMSAEDVMALFEEKRAKVPAMGDWALVGRFLAICAKGNNMTTDEATRGAVENWAAFEKSFAKFAAGKAGSKVSKAIKAKIDPDPDPLLPCPNGDDMFQSYCDQTCKSREGCPTHLDDK